MMIVGDFQDRLALSPRQYINVVIFIIMIVVIASFLLALAGMEANWPCCFAGSIYLLRGIISKIVTVERPSRAQ